MEKNGENKTTPKTKEVQSMTIFDVLSLLCGLALFLYGMDVMGDALKKSAGNQLKSILGKMTSNQFKGFLLGLGVTMIIQSSSATTVMVVGFVNSATMTLTQAIGVIMGANVGTAVTAWLTGMSGMGEGEGVTAFAKWLKPDTWMPILAIIGICLIMFVKRGKKRELGTILLGFAVLMTGMAMMSDSVAGLKDSESFKSILTMFNNPILGVLAGLVLTAIVQSSSASVGILQSLTTTGAITFGAAIPIVMGQNIGTCVTAMISSLGASKNGKRAAWAHLYFNVISVVVWLSAFYAVDAFVDFAFVDQTINMWGVAFVHTFFKILAVALLAPFTKLLEKLAVATVKGEENGVASRLDERLLATPAIALESANAIASEMATVSCSVLKDAISLLSEYDSKKADTVRDGEDAADKMEDALGSYLVKLSAENMLANDSHKATMLLHIIGDYERISDHAVNIAESAEEMKDKKLSFSAEAQKELATLTAAVSEILTLTEQAFTQKNLATALYVEPLEQVIDDLRDRIKANHVLRLQKSECTIEHGFILSDLLNNLERVADHCSNVAACLLEMREHDGMAMHKYLSALHNSGGDFDARYNDYAKKYAL